MTESLIVLGNSHLTHFRRFVTKNRTLLEQPFETYYVSSNILETLWFKFYRNDFLRLIHYRQNLAETIDLRNSIRRTHLLLIGMGLDGSGNLCPFGTIKAAKAGEDPALLSPKIPGIKDRDKRIRSSQTDQSISSKTLRRQYDYYWKIRLKRLQNLVLWGNFISVNWIVEPHMTERAARARFGEDILESGLYAYISDIARERLIHQATQMNIIDHLIFHTNEFTKASGFTDSTQHPSKREGDVHVLPEYYASSLKIWTARLENPPVTAAPTLKQRIAYWSETAYERLRDRVKADREEQDD